MSNTLTIRIPEELAQWLEETSKATGTPKGQIVRAALERDRDRSLADKPWAHLIGCIDGPADLSTRKGLQGMPYPGSSSKSRKKAS